MSATDPFDGGIVKWRTANGTQWVSHSNAGGPCDATFALGIFAALANLGRIMPWTAVVPPWVAEHSDEFGWLVLRGDDSALAEESGQITEHQAHAIATVLNGTRLPDEVRLTEAERAVLLIVERQGSLIPSNWYCAELRKERGIA